MIPLRSLTTLALRNGKLTITGPELVQRLVRISTGSRLPSTLWPRSHDRNGYPTLTRQRKPLTASDIQLGRKPQVQHRRQVTLPHPPPCSLAGPSHLEAAP